MQNSVDLIVPPPPDPDQGDEWLAVVSRYAEESERGIRLIRRLVMELLAEFEDRTGRFGRPAERTAYCWDWDAVQALMYPESNNSVYAAALQHVAGKIGEDESVLSCILPPGTQLEMVWHLRKLLREQAQLHGRAGDLNYTDSGAEVWTEALRLSSHLRTAVLGVSRLAEFLRSSATPLEQTELHPFVRASRTNNLREGYERELERVRPRASKRNSADARNLAATFELSIAESGSLDAKLVTTTRPLRDVASQLILDPLTYLFRYELERNYPEPANRHALLDRYLAALSNAVLHVHQIRGRLEATSGGEPDLHELVESLRSIWKSASMRAVLQPFLLAAEDAANRADALAASVASEKLIDPSLRSLDYFEQLTRAVDMIVNVSNGRIIMQGFSGLTITKQLVGRAVISTLKERDQQPFLTIQKHTDFVMAKWPSSLGLGSFLLMIRDVIPTPIDVMIWPLGNEKISIGTSGSIHDNIKRALGRTGPIMQIRFRDESNTEVYYRPVRSDIARDAEMCVAAETLSVQQIRRLYLLSFKEYIPGRLIVHCLAAALKQSEVG